MDYVILSGARRQENRWDPTKNGQVIPETNETQKRLFDDAMYKIEHGVGDESKANSAKPHLVNMFNRNESTWADNYTANSQLRITFRVSYKDVPIWKVHIEKHHLFLEKKRRAEEIKGCGFNNSC